MIELGEEQKNWPKIVFGIICGAIGSGASLLAYWQFYSEPTPKLVVEMQYAQFEMPPQPTDWRWRTAEYESDPAVIAHKNDKVDWNPFDIPMDEFYEEGRVRYFYSVSVTNDGTAEAENVGLKVGGTGMYTVTKEGRTHEKNPMPFSESERISLGSLPIGDNVTVKIWRPAPPSEDSIRLTHKSGSQPVRFDKDHAPRPLWQVLLLMVPFMLLFSLANRLIEPVATVLTRVMERVFKLPPEDLHTTKQRVKEARASANNYGKQGTEKGRPDSPVR